ncbi:hypothetical protein [Nocardia testacea]
MVLTCSQMRPACIGEQLQCCQINAAGILPRPADHLEQFDSEVE